MGANKDIAENLLQAMDILFQERIKSINFDTTIACTIVNDEKANEGEYTVSDGSVSFTAYSLETGYKNDDGVLVTIPNNDYSQPKIIIGRQATKKNTAAIFQSPFETLVNVTNNLIEGEYKDLWLWANHGYKGNVDRDKHAFWTWSAEDSNSAALTGYDRIGLRGEFSTWLSNLGCCEGNYGILLRVCFRPDAKSEEDVESEEDVSTKTFFLDSDDFYGDKYSFESYYVQEAVFDISSLKDQYITSMALFFYQKGNFKDRAERLIESPPYIPSNNDDQKYYGGDGEDLSEVVDAEENAFQILPNIFLRDPYLCLGYDLGSFQKEKGMLITLSTLTYDFPVATGEDENTGELYFTDNDLYKKEIGLRWIHDFGNDRIQSVSYRDFINNLGEDSSSEYEIRWYRESIGAKKPDKFMGANWVLYRRYFQSRQDITQQHLTMPEDLQNLSTIINVSTNITNFTINNPVDVDSTYLTAYNAAYNYIIDNKEKIGWYQNCADELASNYNFCNSIIELYQNIVVNFDTVELYQGYIKETLPTLQNMLKDVDDPFQLSFYPDINKEQEKFQVVIIKNDSEIARTNQLVFTNLYDIPSTTTTDISEALGILCGHRQENDIFYLEPEQGMFFIYKKGNELVDEHRAKERFSLTATFRSMKDSKTNPEDNLLNGATCITWMFPSSNTMLRPVFYLDTFIELEKATLRDPTTDEVELLKRAFGTTENRLVIVQTEDRKLLATFNTATKLIELTHFGDIVSGDLSDQFDLITAHYFIRKTYAPNLVDNTVHCQIVKDKITYHVTKDLLFGQSGTSGSSYTVSVTFDNNQNALSVYGEQASTLQGYRDRFYQSVEGRAMDLGDINSYYALIAQVHLYGQNGKEIDLLTSVDSNIEAYKNIPNDNDPNNIAHKRSLGLILREKYSTVLDDTYWDFYSSSGLQNPNQYNASTTIGATIKTAKETDAFNRLNEASKVSIDFDWLVAEMKTNKEAATEYTVETEDLLYPIFFNDQSALKIQTGQSSTLDQSNVAYPHSANNYFNDTHTNYYFEDGRNIGNVLYYTSNTTSQDFSAGGYYYYDNGKFNLITTLSSLPSSYFTISTSNNVVTYRLKNSVILYRRAQNDINRKYKIEFEIFPDFSAKSGEEIVIDQYNNEGQLLSDNRVQMNGSGTIRVLTNTDSIENAAEVLYNKVGKLYIQRNGMFILDTAKEWNEVETYYYPVYTQEVTHLTTPLICTNADNITRKRISINTQYYQDINNYITLSEIMNSLNILRVTIKNFGDYDLVASYPIPIRRVLLQNQIVTVSNTNYTLIKEPRALDYSLWYDSIEGATSIRYTSSGEAPEYYKNPYKAYVIQDGKLITDPQAYQMTWTLLIPSNSVFSSGADLAFQPKLNNDILEPLNMYIPNAPNYGIQYRSQIVFTGENAAFWTQPILVYQDNYPSSTINAWNGTDIETDNDTGTILASALAAGKKETDNTFTGVMIGDWSRTDTCSSITKKTGIYGFHKGAMSYAFKEDGTGFIGKDGKGRIFLGGDNSTIYSNNWLIRKEGMMMDLDDGFIHMSNKVAQQLKTFNTSTNFITFLNTKEATQSLWVKKDFISLLISTQNSSFSFTNVNNSVVIYMPDLTSAQSTKTFDTQTYLPNYDYFYKVETNVITEEKVAKKNNWSPTTDIYYDIVSYPYNSYNENFPAIVYSITEETPVIDEGQTKYNYSTRTIKYLGLSQAYTGHSTDTYNPDLLYYFTNFTAIVKGDNKSYSQHSVFSHLTSSNRNLIKGILYTKGNDISQEDDYREFGYEITRNNTVASNNSGGNHFDPLAQYYVFDLSAGNVTRHITLGANEKTYPLAIGVEKSTSRRPFRVNWNGDVYIANGDFTGNINAKTGTLGNLTVVGTLTGGIIDGGYITGGEIHGTFIEAGELYANEGMIGGWTIAENELYSGDVHLKSNTGAIIGATLQGGLAKIGRYKSINGAACLIISDSAANTGMATFDFLSSENGRQLLQIWADLISGSEVRFITGGNRFASVDSSNGNLYIYAPAISCHTPAENQHGIYARFA